LVLGLIVGGVA